MRLKERVGALEQQLSDQQPPSSVDLPSDFDFEADFQKFLAEPKVVKTPEQEYAELCAMKPAVWRPSKRPSADALIGQFFRERKLQLEREYGFSEETQEQSPAS